MHRTDIADPDVVEFIRLGQRVSLQYRVVLRNRATFDAVMAASWGGSNFDPHKVVRTIGTLFDDAGKVEFGAEHSAVLYLEVPFFTGQRLAAPAGMGEPYTDQQRQDYARRVIGWARRMRADEITVQQYPIIGDLMVDNEPGEHPYRIRIWWD